MEKDPVSGMLVDPKQAIAQREYQGKTYYLCSPTCLDRFDQAPQRYVSADKLEQEQGRTRN